MKRKVAFLMALALLCTACAAPAATPTGGGADIAPTPTTTAPPRVTVDGITYVGDGQVGLVAADGFELPLRGSTGFISVDTPFYATADRGSAPLATLPPGEAFTVLAAPSEDTWHVRREDGTEGYVENTTCYLNVVDVIPSIVLDNTNSYSSVFLSSGKAIPTITGEALYHAKAYNPRFGEEHFMVACNWRMVQKLYVAQQAALAAGYTLVLNEAFRPMDVQLDIAAALQALYDTDEQVKQGIDTPPWRIAWFIANRPSTHQMGCAIDTSLAKVTEIEYRLCGDYRYRVVTACTPCGMPTPIHELSAAAVAMAKPVSSTSLTAWQTAEPAATMTEDALRLQEFCTAAGMTPIASEWWHFNDLETKARIGERFTTQPFYLDTCRSQIPPSR